MPKTRKIDLWNRFCEQTRQIIPDDHNWPADTINPKLHLTTQINRKIAIDQGWLDPVLDWGKHDHEEGNATNTRCCQAITPSLRKIAINYREVTHSEGWNNQDWDWPTKIKTEEILRKINQIEQRCQEESWDQRYQVGNWNSEPTAKTSPWYQIVHGPQ